MKIVAITALAVVVATFVVSCRPDEEEDISEVEFVAGTQEGIISRTQGYSIMKKVHKDKLIIDYKFDGNCGGRFKGQPVTRLKEAISQSLRVWLAPLKSRGNIVDTFEFRESEFKIINKPDFIVIFKCKVGRSYVIDTTFTALKLNLFQMTDNVRDSNKYYKIPSVTSQNKYSLATLHHEIGHIIGLGDTYVDESFLAGLTRHTDSDGGATTTIGSQPLSVMNSHLMAVSSTGELQLGADDVAGVNWLYRYYIVGDIDRDDCPGEYRYEESTKGCVPIYPVIFAVTQNNYHAVRKLLASDTKHINQQDTRGNTALHYAAISLELHGDKLYKYLLDKGANKLIKNNNGDTAEEIYQLLSQKITIRNLANSFYSAVKLGGVEKVFAVLSSDDFLMEVLWKKQHGKAIHVSLQRIPNKLSEIINKQTERGESPQGRTLLHMATANGATTLIKWLFTIDNLDINVQTKLSKETALHYAARFNRLQTTKLLLEHSDIDLKLEDTWGRTPLLRAVERGHKEVADAIRAAVRERQQPSPAVE